MRKSMDELFSHSAKNMRASEIRELLKLLNKPEMISFAGGLPNPDAFPIEGLKPVLQHVMEVHARDALQYGVTEGHNKLRDAIAKGMNSSYGLSLSMQQILVTTGSQQALNLLAQIFLNPGDVVLTESPSYLGALLTFYACQARVEAVSMDDDGLRMDLLEEKLHYLQQHNQLPKFIYSIPNFQNPTGISMSLERRKRLYDLLVEYDLLLVEDDPYGLLRFEGEAAPLIKNLDQDERVVYLGSFSKVLAPGFRVGWLAGPTEIVNRVSLAKQAQDLCTNTFGQYCVYEVIHHNLLFPHVREIVKLYKTKRDVMLEALAKYFPKGITWNRPQGGMFIWVTLPPRLNALDMLPRAIENNVAYVNGEPFFPGGSGQNTLRLNFSYSSDAQIREGIKRLGSVITQELQRIDSEMADERMEIF